ncbi:MAG TPA: PIN domain-containing protein [Candidatus Norongarragalinales archaeon]|nr:PIN domain-containing protein [Candidatus Norongarragalinales archaeon]
MNLVDTNILIADFNPSDKQHSRVRQARIEDPVINELVFVETANVFEKRVHSKDHVLRLVQHIRNEFPMEWVTTPNLDTAIGFFSKYYGKLSFTDCVLLAQAKNRKLQLATFDENLKNAASLEGVKVLAI